MKELRCWSQDFWPLYKDIACHSKHPYNTACAGSRVVNCNWLFSHPLLFSGDSCGMRPCLGSGEGLISDASPSITSFKLRHLLQKTAQNTRWGWYIQSKRIPAYHRLAGQQGKTSPELSRLAFPYLPNTPLQQVCDRPGSHMHFSTEWEMSLQSEKLSQRIHCKEAQYSQLHLY